MKETILVVEDGDAVRNLVCLMLVQNGYRVLEARDGHHALRVCATHSQPIQLVLTDLMMPKMRGADLAERLRRARRDLRILMMSGYPDEPTVQRLGRDSVAFLPKPFTSVELVEKVRQVLDAPWNGSRTERSPDG
ncbi:MAG TPA: response regulator [Bryobacteraceae bacterium]|nr:response regulator [Bryobacteraceae bacterium]